MPKRSPVEVEALLLRHLRAAWDHVVAQGDEIATRIDGWLGDIRGGRAAAVAFETPVPWDDDSQRALEQLREATPAQLAFARYGHAGLLCGEVPEFATLLGEAPAGAPGPLLRRACDALILPHVDAQGNTTLVGALCWRGPYAPILVHPFAVEVLQRLDGARPVEALADDLDATPRVLHNIARQLVEVGALTA